MASTTTRVAWNDGEDSPGRSFDLNETSLQLNDLQMGRTFLLDDNDDSFDKLLRNSGREDSVDRFFGDDVTSSTPIASHARGLRAPKSRLGELRPPAALRFALDVPAVAADPQVAPVFWNGESAIPSRPPPTLNEVISVVPRVPERAISPPEHVKLKETRILGLGDGKENALRRGEVRPAVTSSRIPGPSTTKLPATQGSAIPKPKGKPQLTYSSHSRTNSSTSIPSSSSTYVPRPPPPTTIAIAPNPPTPRVEHRETFEITRKTESHTALSPYRVEQVSKDQSHPLSQKKTHPNPNVRSLSRDGSLSGSAHNSLSTTLDLPYHSPKSLLTAESNSLFDTTITDLRDVPILLPRTQNGKGTALPPDNQITASPSLDILPPVLHDEVLERETNAEIMVPDCREAYPVSVDISQKPSQLTESPPSPTSSITSATEHPFPTSPSPPPRELNSTPLARPLEPSSSVIASTPNAIGKFRPNSIPISSPAMSAAELGIISTPTPSLRQQMFARKANELELDQYSSVDADPDQLVDTSVISRQGGGGLLKKSVSINKSQRGRKSTRSSGVPDWVELLPTPNLDAEASSSASHGFAAPTSQVHARSRTRSPTKIIPASPRRKSTRPPPIVSEDVPSTSDTRLALPISSKSPVSPIPAAMGISQGQKHAKPPRPSSIPQGGTPLKTLPLIRATSPAKPHHSTKKLETHPLPQGDVEFVPPAHSDADLPSPVLRQGHARSSTEEVKKSVIASLTTVIRGRATLHSASSISAPMVQKESGDIDRSQGQEGAANAVEELPIVVATPRVFKSHPEAVISSVDAQATTIETISISDDDDDVEEGGADEAQPPAFIDPSPTLSRTSSPAAEATVSRPPDSQQTIPTFSPPSSNNTSRASSPASPSIPIHHIPTPAIPPSTTAVVDRGYEPPSPIRADSPLPNPEPEIEPGVEEDQEEQEEMVPERVILHDDEEEELEERSQKEPTPVYARDGTATSPIDPHEDAADDMRELVQPQPDRVDAIVIPEPRTQVDLASRNPTTISANTPAITATKQRHHQDTQAPKARPAPKPAAVPSSAQPLSRGKKVHPTSSASSSKPPTAVVPVRNKILNEGTKSGGDARKPVEKQPVTNRVRDNIKPVIPVGKISADVAAKAKEQQERREKREREKKAALQAEVPVGRKPRLPPLPPRVEPRLNPQSQPQTSKASIKPQRKIKPAKTIQPSTTTTHRPHAPNRPQPTQEPTARPKSRAIQAEQTTNVNEEPPVALFGADYFLEHDGAPLLVYPESPYGRVTQGSQEPIAQAHSASSSSPSSSRLQASTVDQPEPLADSHDMELDVAVSAEADDEVDPGFNVDDDFFAPAPSLPKPPPTPPLPPVHPAEEPSASWKNNGKGKAVDSNHDTGNQPSKRAPASQDSAPSHGSKRTPRENDALPLLKPTNSSTATRTTATSKGPAIERVMLGTDQPRAGPSKTGSEGSKRPPMESPVRERVLMTKKSRVDAETVVRRAPLPMTTTAVLHDRRRSGASLASAIVIDDDGDDEVEDEVPEAQIRARQLNKGKGKRLSAEPLGAHAKRMRMQLDVRRIVSNPILKTTASGSASSWGRPPRGPVHRPLAVPVAGAVPGEASRLRALEREKREKERKRREELDRKAAERRQLEYARPPSRQTQNPATELFGGKKTVPRPFTFSSDTRAERHRNDFDNRLAEWETRTRAAASAAVNPVPDFAARQAQHVEQIQRARVKARAQVTAPKTPGLKTKSRAKERGQFDDQLREKEKVVFRLREARQQEDQDRERREIQELRKRLDDKVKAKPVPEWIRKRNEEVEDDDSDIQSGEEF